jgi:wyosine [tRNA(Phe)-imidazoG37] synthetase (radical SAM superfamily)
MESIAFGPVPSRRLGRSLGINNVPVKTCSYSCVYCQVGPTARPELERKEYFAPDEVVAAVSGHVRALRDRGEPMDFLTFVPDGEPTLDRHLGDEIDGLGSLGIPVAVISNSSLIWREDVRATLRRAAWVSLKVDAVEPDAWRRVNRPHPALDLDDVLEGIGRFAKQFDGELVTETMLVRGVNDSSEAVDALGDYLAGIRPRVAYLAVPTRPPSEPWVRPASPETVESAFRRLSERLPRVELLTTYEGEVFGATGDAVGDLLAITAVHPLREDAVRALLGREGADPQVLDRLLEEGALRPVEYRGHTFYVRRGSRSR